MTSLASKTSQDFNRLLTIYGQQVRFRYFTGSPASAGSSYDDAIGLVQSGTDYWVSGAVENVNGPKGTGEGTLWAQGRIIYGDTRLYVPGYVATSGLFKVWIGSATGIAISEYAITEAGQNEWQIGGTAVYKKCFLRVLPNGSLARE